MTMDATRRRNRYVNASELGSFVYCQRAWWLERQGVPSARAPERADGTAYHGQHGARVRAATGAARLARACLALGLLLLLLGLVLAWR